MVDLDDDNKKDLNAKMFSLPCLEMCALENEDPACLKNQFKESEEKSFKFQDIVNGVILNNAMSNNSIQGRIAFLYPKPTGNV